MLFVGLRGIRRNASRGPRPGAPKAGGLGAAMQQGRIWSSLAFAGQRLSSSDTEAAADMMSK